MILFSLCVVSKNPTFRYFQIPEGFNIVDIHQPIVQECFEFSKEQCPKFIDELRGPHSIVLLHAWKRITSEGQYVAIEVFRLRQKYLVTIFLPNNQTENKYIYKFNVLNSESPSGSTYVEPSEEVLEETMSAVKKQFGEESSLINIISFKTIMQVDTIGYLPINVNTPQGRKLLDVRLCCKFGEEDFHFKSLEVIE